MDQNKTNLAGTFLEIARNHIQAKEALESTTILNHCAVCCHETQKDLHRESPTSEFYQCIECHVIFEYKVR